MTALTGASAMSAINANSAQAGPGDKTAPATYVPISEKGAPSGVATLDAASKILPAQLPDFSATYVGKGSLVFNVKDYGALGNWNGATGNDDTPAIQQAIDAAVSAGGGVVLFPAGNYRVQPQVARTVDPGTNSSSQGHTLLIAGNNVTLRGAGKGSSKLSFRAYGGGDPTTSYQTVLGKVWRGGGIFITGGSTSGTTRRNITIEHLELDGGCTYTGLNSWPASTATGDGWDITNKGVWMQNDTHIDNVTVQDCSIHNFRGEIIYAGGILVGKVTGSRLELYGTNGDCWSCSATVLLEDSLLYQAAGHGVEDAYFSADCHYRSNKVRDCALTGISVFSASAGTPPFGNAYIENNLVDNCPGHGIESISPQNMVIRNNTIIDCGVDVGKRCITIDTNGGYTGTGVRGLTLTNNRMLARAVNIRDGILFADAAARGFAGVTIMDNRCELTAVGVAAGKTFNQSYNFDVMNDTKALIRNNTGRLMSFKYTDQMVGNDVLLTGTGATDVVKVRPEVRKNFIVNVAYRVITADTNITINITFYDGSGTSRTINVVPSTLKTVGFYTVAPTFINAQGASESQYVKVTAAAGTASQVYVSAAISEVPTS
jgi:hypothetical protein